MPLKSRPGPKLRILEVSNDNADHAITAQLLLIGDDPALMSEQLRRAFPAPSHRVQVVSTGRVGLEHIRNCSPDVIILDLCLPDQCGLEVYQQIRGMNARIPVIFVTRTSRADLTIEVIKQGAYDCLFKPFDLSVLRRVVGEALDVARRMRLPAAVEETGMDLDAEDGIVRCCSAMGEVYKAIGRVAGQTFPVLITGESGTGTRLADIA
jgi:two-component system nitrogen regulation response regulator GlnG